MISYELAKELEKAGWNKETLFQYRVDWMAGDGGMQEQKVSLVYRENYETKGDDGLSTMGSYLIWSPTLGELIEACLEPRGESDNRKQFFLEMYFLERSSIIDMKWRASRDMDWRRADVEMGETSTAGFGQTPEEAVARLWLALNRK